MPDRARPPLPGLAKASDRARQRWGLAPAAPPSEPPPPPPPAAPACAAVNDCNDDCDDVELRRAA